MDDKLREIVRSENPDFKELEKKHQEYEKQLEELGQMPFLTTDLQLKEKEIKKLKLKTKDEMERILEKFLK